jgi:hypothetical protein
MWIQDQNGNYWQLEKFSKLYVSENGSQGTWNVASDTTNIAVVSTQAEAEAILAAIVGSAGAVTFAALSAGS